MSDIKEWECFLCQQILLTWTVKSKSFSFECTVQGLNQVAIYRDYRWHAGSQPRRATTYWTITDLPVSASFEIAAYDNEWIK